MKTNAGKYLERPIGENEEELLEKIWNSLPPVENDDQMLDENYRNVKQRIHKHTLRRHVIYRSMLIYTFAIQPRIIRKVSCICTIK